MDKDTRKAGLDLWLTEQLTPASTGPLLIDTDTADHMMMLTHARRLDLAKLSEEIDAGFDAFAKAMGRAPDFVDAHQHVRVFPGIYRAVVAAPLHHAPGSWMRHPADPLMAALRHLFADQAIGSSFRATGLGAALQTPAS
jgi:predicted glycoside hydrolase/deacetylase ChbG (UPF0249 family)